jgi:PAS domain S-box-containing protein
VPPEKPFSPLYPVLGLVFTLMLVLMFLYELAKQYANPSLTLWESHAITILFTSILAVVIVYYPLRTAFCEQQHAKAALLSRQEAEEKLRRSEMQYRSFVESVEDSLYTVDVDQNYLLINTRHLVRRGLSPDVYLGRKYGDFHSADETRKFSALIDQVVRTRTSVQDEYEQNGRYFIRKLNPVTDAKSSAVMAVTVISSDITDRRLTEKNLSDTNRKLNLMNDITRHDILNQLTVLSSYLSLAEGCYEDHAREKYLVRSEQVIETIQAQILFARDYQTIGIESPRWQNVQTTLIHARQSLKIPHLEIDPSCGRAEIFADPLLEKVFYNLMENSTKYGSADTVIRFSCHERNGTHIITCEDNGNGISYEEKERIFLRGYGKNTGLGLFLIREILAITGIRIRETGEPGKGARFDILLPEGGLRVSFGS